MKLRKKLYRKAKKNSSILVKLFAYTFLLISISSAVTYFAFAHNSQNVLGVSGEKSLRPEENYIERGSPYDIANNEKNPLVILHGPRDKKQIALTFDAEMTDGMKAAYVSGTVKSSYDKRIIDILNKTKTKATLFLTGMWIELYPKETEEFARNPLFELGSHSYTDSSYHGACFGLKELSRALAMEDLGTTEKLLRERAGVDNQLFRFPGGCYSPDDVKLVNQIGDTVVHWDTVGEDGFNENTNQIISNVVDRTQNGSIIVLHMNGAPTAPKTADALPMIIEKLNKKGFEFVKVSELLGSSEERYVH
jgi:peptidoglycan/xylan/chitin deacetylase (PgdA/CDA1 family)